MKVLGRARSPLDGRCAFPPPRAPLPSALAEWAGRFRSRVLNMHTRFFCLCQKVTAWRSPLLGSYKPSNPSLNFACRLPKSREDASIASLISPCDALRRRSALGVAMSRAAALATRTFTLPPLVRSGSSPTPRRAVANARVVTENNPGRKLCRCRARDTDTPSLHPAVPSTLLLTALVTPPPALALLETSDGSYISDPQVIGVTLSLLFLVATKSLSEGSHDSPADELRFRVSMVEPLELRLYITTLWCSVLARDLCTPPAGGWELSLGFDAQDVSRLAKIFLSGCELSVFWIAVGVVVGQFTRSSVSIAAFSNRKWDELKDDADENSENSPLTWYLKPGWTTGLVAGIAWQLAESYSNAFINAAVDTSRFGDAVLRAPAACVDFSTAVPSVLALVAAMQTYRLVSFYVP